MIAIRPSAQTLAVMNSYPLRVQVAAAIVLLGVFVTGCGPRAAPEGKFRQFSAPYADPLRSSCPLLGVDVPLEATLRSHELFEAGSETRRRMIVELYEPTPASALERLHEALVDQGFLPATTDMPELGDRISYNGPSGNVAIVVASIEADVAPPFVRGTIELERPITPLATSSGCRAAPLPEVVL